MCRRVRDLSGAVVVLALLGVVGGLLVGCGARGSARARLRAAERVEAVAGELVDTGARRVVVLVSDHGRMYVATRGARATQRFRIGSATKAFTATMVLELAAEGRLHLDDPIERYLPGVVPAGRKITVRELLDGRSGLADYGAYPAWRERLQRSSSLRPIDDLRFAASQPLEFAPGTHWSGNDTNSTALGLIIEAITHRSYAQQLQQRILTPLGLSNTDLARTRVPAGLHDPGVSPSGPWASGGIVSTAQELVRFFSALLAGRILSRAWLAQMKETLYVGSYGGSRLEDGLGILLTRACGRLWWQAGFILGYATTVGASDDGARVAVISTRETSDQPVDFGLLCRLLGRREPTR